MSSKSSATYEAFDWWTWSIENGHGTVQLADEPSQLVAELRVVARAGRSVRQRLRDPANGVTAGARDGEERPNHACDKRQSGRRAGEGACLPERDDERDERGCQQRPS